jgi:hypothetical protein
LWITSYWVHHPGSPSCPLTLFAHLHFLYSSSTTVPGTLLYVPPTHTVYVPPFDPLKPGFQVQVVIVMFLMGKVELIHTVDVPPLDPKKLSHRYRSKREAGSKWEGTSRYSHMTKNVGGFHIKNPEFLI